MINFRVKGEMIQSDLHRNMQLTSMPNTAWWINNVVPYNWMNSVNILTRKTKTIPSQAKSQLLEGVETTGGRMVFLNNQLERPATLLTIFVNNIMGDS